MSMDASGNETVERTSFGHPSGHLRDVPPEWRWELTRRHPYYVAYWPIVRLYLRGETFIERYGAELGPLVGKFATATLATIGVVGDPPDPATDYDKLADAGDRPVFIGAAIRPLTLRQAAIMLLANLPPEVRAHLADVFAKSAEAVDAGGGDIGAAVQRMKGLEQLNRVAHPVLDAMPVAPVFVLDAGASARTVGRDLQDFMRVWKRRDGGPQKRARTDNYSDYLEVWDRVEGWSGGGYDPTREVGPAAAAKALKENLTTVISRYRSAFRLITGHEYSPQLWEHLMGPVKVAAFYGDPGASAEPVLRRTKRRPGRKVQFEDPAADRLASEIISLIRRGRSDEAIIEELGLTDERPVKYLRRRAADMAEI